MKETNFIKQNIEKWKTYETELTSKKKDPAKVSKLFVQITDDLAYAQTFYQNRSVRVYLNGIAQQLFNDINKSKRFKWKAFVNFWKIDLPIAAYKSRFELMFSFLVFSIMMAIGVISSINDPGFAEKVLGSSYVEMTLTNIENDDPMAVYKEQNGFDMFLGITLNNILVALRTFVMGLFFGLGTFFILIRNGIMVGAFQFFFIERDLFKESFLTIWQHGTLEISSIVIAGAAGFVIGRGLIVPGTYSRLQSLRISARRGLTIMVGLIPVFIMAGFIEGFFTRLTDLPDAVRWSTILLSASFILFYFVLYPIAVARKFPEKLKIVTGLNKKQKELPDFKSILNTDKLFRGTMQLLKTNTSNLLKCIAILSGLTALYITFGKKSILPFLSDNLIEQKFLLWKIIQLNEHLLLFTFNTFIYATSFLFGAFLILKTKKKYSVHFFKFLRSYPRAMLKAISAAILFQGVFFLPPALGILLMLFVGPLTILSFFTSHHQKVSYFKGIGRTFKLIKRNFGTFMALNFFYFLLIAVVLLLAHPKLYQELLSFITWTLWIEKEYMDMISNFVMIFVIYGALLLGFFMLAICNNLLYHTLLEISTSRNLINSVKKIGLKNTLRGYELE